MDLLSPPGCCNDLPWAGPDRSVLDPLVDHPHCCPGRHTAADPTGLPAVEGNPHVLLHMCCQNSISCRSEFKSPLVLSCYLTQHLKPFHSVFVELFHSSFSIFFLKHFFLTYPFPLFLPLLMLSFPFSNSVSLFFISHSFPNLFFPFLHSGHLLSSVASSSAPSHAATMRRSTTAPTWGSSPRRWRSRHQNYNTMNISLWPALSSSSSLSRR